MLSRIPQLARATSRTGLATRRVAARRTVAPRRLMSEKPAHGHGGSGHAAGGPKKHPDYEGFEAYVRYYLPHNHQIVYAVLGVYGGIFLFVKTLNGMSAARAAANAPAPQKPDFHTEVERSDIPSMEDDGFTEFVDEDDGNFEKWLMNAFDTGKM